MSQCLVAKTKMLGHTQTTERGEGNAIEFRDRSVPPISGGADKCRETADGGLFAAPFGSGVFDLARVPKDQIPRRAREVLRYFVENPQAADSLEGIARWRLLEEPVRRRVDEVARAIEWLVGEGFLEEIAGRSSGAVFRLNDDLSEQARTLVQSHKRRLH